MDLVPWYIVLVLCLSTERTYFNVIDKIHLHPSQRVKFEKSYGPMPNFCHFIQCLIPQKKILSQQMDN